MTVIKKADVDNYRASKAKARLLPFRAIKSVPDATGFSQPVTKTVKAAEPAGASTASANIFRKL